MHAACGRRVRVGIIYRVDSSDLEFSPAQMQAMYAKFNEWREAFQRNIVDLGGRLGAGRVVLPEPPPDGPLAELKELVGGYMILSASSLEEAVQIARECPGLVRPGSGVEVIEIHAPG